MKIKEEIFTQFIKNGYAPTNGNKIWDISNRKFLYLTPGLAKSFLKIRAMPFYKDQIVNREITLIQQHIPEIFQNISGSFNLIDIFCGDGTKAAAFLKTIQNNFKIRYVPVNINSFLTDLAVKNIKKEKFASVAEFKPKVCDCNGESAAELVSALRSSRYQKNVILILGSVLASYQINDYLFQLSNGMLKGDILIIGNGVRKGDRLVNLDLYKNKTWDEWFETLVESLGFNRKELEYNARFGNSRVEMLYKVKKDKELKYKNKKFQFKQGDEILTAILYKYYPNELEEFCKMYFSDVKLVKDKDEEYALVVCKK